MKAFSSSIKTEFYEALYTCLMGSYLGSLYILRSEIVAFCANAKMWEGNKS